MPHFGIALNKYYWVHIYWVGIVYHFSFKPYNNPRRLVSFSRKETAIRWLAQKNQGWTQVWQFPNFRSLPIQRADLHMEQSSHDACRFPLAFLQDEKSISNKPGWLVINLEEMSSLKCPPSKRIPLRGPCFLQSEKMDIKLSFYPLSRCCPHLRNYEVLSCVSEIFITISPL